jgi:HEPN domain-containing protein
VTPNRIEFQELAKLRIEDARILLAEKRWEAAYYLAGYAVECALKACVAKLTKADDFPDKEKATKAWTHKLDVLLDVADLEKTRDAERAANLRFEAYWLVVMKWKEDTRYKRSTQLEAENIYQAVADPVDGVLRWIRLHW